MFTSDNTHVHVCYLLSPVPTQAVEISTIFLRHLVPWPSVDIHVKFYGDHSPGELNTRGVVKYSDFGPIEGYISEMVQDRM